MHDSEEISAKQEKLIGFLLTERTVEAACSKADVAPSTFWRWMQTKPFKDEYRRLRRGVLENTISKLQSLSHQAIDTLERNLTCETPAAEIRSAQIILEQSIRGMEMLDLEQRIEYLESSAQQEGNL